MQATNKRHANRPRPARQSYLNELVFAHFSRASHVEQFEERHGLVEDGHDGLSAHFRAFPARDHVIEAD